MISESNQNLCLAFNVDSLMQQRCLYASHVFRRLRQARSRVTGNVLFQESRHFIRSVLLLTCSVVAKCRLTAKFTG